MDGFDFTSHDAFLDYAEALTSQDSRSHSYPPLIPPNPHAPWHSLSLESLENGAANMSHQPHHHQHGQPCFHQQHHHHAAQQQQQPQQHHQHQQQQLQPQQQAQPALMAPASGHQQSQNQQLPSQPTSSSKANQPITLQTSGLNMDYMNIFPTGWQYQISQPAAQQHQQQNHQHSQPPQFGVQSGGGLNVNAFTSGPSYGAQLQASPIDFNIATSNAENFIVTTGMDTANFMTMAGPMDSMNALVYPLQDYQNGLNFPVGLNGDALNQQALNQHAAAAAAADSVGSSLAGGSPTGTALEIQSLSDNEGSWSLVSFNQNRQSIDSFGTVSNPSQNLHIRTNSDSSSSEGPHSADLSGSYEEIPPWPLSPHDFHHGPDYIDAQYLQQHTSAIPIPGQHNLSPPQSLAVSPTTGATVAYRSSASSSSTSPTSSGPTSPPLRRRKSPLEGKTTKAVITKKTTVSSIRKDAGAEKKVGRRRGPLRPDQRQQAHEIRKLRACLRCKFLKKTCDKGEPCGGCRPSHARLWQVPCTRMDIKDIAYFMKDWKADFERHVTLGFSVGNIKGFSTMERPLYVTHGYGHYLPINAREVFVRDENCFNVDWVETTNSVDPDEFEFPTAKLSAGLEGVSITLLSEYLDKHLDQNFEDFVDDLFEGTKFVTEILKTAHRYYLKEKTPSIRKALKLVLAYNLTTHVSFVEGISEEEDFAGRIDNPASKYHGKIFTPVMVHFQVKTALADMWRELQRDILEELSVLYSSVYSGDKLKNWPTIFMLAAILLAIWEEMQFDCHYRMPDEKAVNKFCEDMETTPVGVIVGLFQAISTKLPGLQEWDTRKHHQLLGSNAAVCDALTEVKGHVNKHEKYLKDRQNAKFDRDDFDCLSNKFLSKLVIRAN